MDINEIAVMIIIMSSVAIFFFFFIHLLMFLMSLRSGLKYAGLLKHLLFWKNISNNIRLASGTLKKENIRHVMKLKNTLRLDRLIWIIIIAVLIIGCSIGIYNDGGCCIEVVYACLVIMGIVLAIGIITYVVKRDDASYLKYYKIQYGMIVDKKERIAGYTRSGKEYLYTVDVMLDDGRLYEEVFVYDGIYYKQMNTGKTECVIFAETPFKAYAVPVNHYIE